MIKYIKLAWFRLISGDTPSFFKIWGAFVGALTVVAALLSYQIHSAPIRIQEKYEGIVWGLNTLVMILGALTAYMTTKNRAISQDNISKALEAAKNAKEQQ